MKDVVGVVTGYTVTQDTLSARVRVFVEGVAVSDGDAALVKADAQQLASGEGRRSVDEHDVCKLLLPLTAIPCDRLVWCEDPEGASLLSAANGTPEKGP